MKSFTSEGIGKQDNADVLIALNESAVTLRTIRNFQEIISRELQIANLHHAIINDTVIEEPG